MKSKILPQRLILKQWQAPGDVLVFTAAVRDFKLTFPEIEIEVSTPYPFLWENNPYVEKATSGGEVYHIGYKTPRQDPSNYADEHFIYAFHRTLEQLFDVKIQRGDPFPDIWLSNNDFFPKIPKNKPILLINAGSKPDFPIKQWPLGYFQAVVDACQEKFTIIQIGRTAGAVHNTLKGVINLINQTPGRLIVALMREASAVLTGVSFPMHLCAAVNHADGLQRKCVVIAGHRENPSWERYPGMDYLYKPCSCVATNQGCWKRWLPPNYLDGKNLCKKPVRLPDSHYYAECISQIKPEDVIKCLL